MNILYIEQSLNPSLGGIEKVTKILSDEFALEGHECFFVFDKTDDVCIDFEHKLKVSYDVSYSMISKQLQSFIECNKIDVVIFQDVGHKYLRRFFQKYRKTHKIKLIYCFHVSPDYWKYFKHGFNIKGIKYYIKRMIGINPYVYDIKRMYGLVDDFVLLSNSFIDDFCAIYKIKDSSKLRAIPNPLPFPPITTIGEKQNIVLIVSRFCERQKNLRSALRIWKLLEEKNPTWKLQIVGYGEDESMLKSYAKALSLKSVSFEGKQDDVYSYYAKAKIFMMTSVFEGFRLTLIEAQQLGCVPIAFDNFSVVHDIIKNGENGYIVKANDEVQYANCCQGLMNNGFLCKSMGKAAIAFSVRFAPNNIIKLWNSVFESI